MCGARLLDCWGMIHVHFRHFMSPVWGSFGIFTNIFYLHMYLTPCWINTSQWHTFVHEFPVCSCSHALFLVEYYAAFNIPEVADCPCGTTFRMCTHVLCKCPLHTTQWHLLLDTSTRLGLSELLGMTKGTCATTKFIVASRAFSKRDPPTVDPSSIPTWSIPYSHMFITHWYILHSMPSALTLTTTQHFTLPLPDKCPCTTISTDPSPERAPIIITWNLLGNVMKTDCP